MRAVDTRDTNIVRFLERPGQVADPLLWERPRQWVANPLSWGRPGQVADPLSQNLL